MIKYRSIEQLVAAAEEKQCRISDIVLEQQASQLEKSKEEIYHMMKINLDVMKESVAHGLNKDLRSSSGLTGGDAYKMKQAVDQEKNICGKLFGNAMVKALSVSETNSCMGKIVSAPTAGSCGVIPAALLTIMEERNIEEEAVVMGLILASGFGMVIANLASISGAEGGCQAEVGSASAMAAAALTEIAGGTPRMAAHACAIALKNLLGLVCDPVAGLVEIPCVKRNAMGVANAFVAAELSLAGIESAIPVDEVIIAMKKVGDSLPHTLKETAEGGLADTPTGRKLCAKVFGGNCSSCNK
ncbi:L-serine ammonia-lyase, iron-sulfur-dependent, subunit alpha [Paludicola sp. MB14-C6]|uniref:L-serine ammonia-lyase, iron-sulfur-dependent, subunit alpha n=1 Tax=Paludihabitans sp. MB14-C6 TaxID=3070656 RepID=UPI0027DDA4F1|nr:L-serine ammonia-lyase, iron-sulfur-dependent, subunit alpha [Paludicola sp. MB14-C6]WMJ23891.1 L-serine ammonia-lyase, iron-sulfur-dependent, subunit alpha [Paludicola sp. MB14-C6]